MPVAARKPQASNPVNDLFIRDLLSVEDSIADLRSYRTISIVDTIDIETLLAATAPIINIQSLTELSIEDKLAHFLIQPIYVQDELGIDVYQNYTEQYKEYQVVEPVDPGDSTGRIENIEQDFAYSSIYPDYYKEFEYIGDRLIGYIIYSNIDKSLVLFSVEFIYSGDILIEKNVTRNSDGRVLTITYQYSGDTLTGLQRTIS